jgi:hypothetical protein
MNPSRRRNLNAGCEYEEPITAKEFADGWHYCKGNVGRVVGPTMENEMRQCDCELERCYYEDHMQSNSHGVVALLVIAAVVMVTSIVVLIFT